MQHITTIFRRDTAHNYFLLGDVGNYNMSGWDSEFRVNVYSVKSGGSHHYTVVENTKQVLKNSLRFYSISIWQVLFQEGPFFLSRKNASGGFRFHTSSQ